MTVRRFLTTPLIAVSLAVPAAGCGQEQADGPTVVTGDDGRATKSAPYRPRVVKENWPEEVPTRGLTKGMVLPLEEFMVSYAERIAVQRARDSAEIACMRRYGFTDWRTEDLGTSPPLADNAANMPRRYGLSDLAEAQRYGYHVADNSQGSTPVPGQDTPEAGTVLLGRNRGEEVASFKGKDLPRAAATARWTARSATPTRTWPRNSTAKASSAPSGPPRSRTPWHGGRPA